MNFNNATPGILKHSLNSIVDSEKAITITAHKNVKNPITTVPEISSGTLSLVRNGTGLTSHIDSNRLQTAIELAKMDVLKIRQMPAEHAAVGFETGGQFNFGDRNEEFQDPGGPAHQGSQPTNSRITSKTRFSTLTPSPTTLQQQSTNLKHEAEILASEVHQLTLELPKTKKKTVAFSKDLTETEKSGLDERKRTLIRLNGKAKQISRTFYSLKTSLLNLSNCKIIKSAIKLINLFYQCLPDLVALKNVQRVESLSWPDLDSALLPVLPIVEMANFLKSLDNQHPVEQILVDELVLVLGDVGKISELKVTNRALLKRDSERRLNETLDAVKRIGVYKNGPPRSSRVSAVGRNSRAVRLGRKLTVRKTHAQKMRERLTGGGTFKRRDSQSKIEDDGHFENYDFDDDFDYEFDDDHDDHDANDNLGIEYQPNKASNNPPPPQKIKAKINSKNEVIRKGSGQTNKIKKELLKKIDGDLEEVFRQVTEIQARYLKIEEEEKCLEQEIIKDFHQASNFKNLNEKPPFIDREILTKNEKERLKTVKNLANVELAKIEKINIDDDDIDSRHQNVVTVANNPKRQKQSALPPPRTLISISRNTSDDIEAYKSKMVIYKNNSRYKNNLASAKNILSNKEIANPDPSKIDPFTTFEALGENLQKEFIKTSSEKLDRILEEIANQMIDDEFVSTKFGDNFEESFLSSLNKSLNQTLTESQNFSLEDKEHEESSTRLSLPLTAATVNKREQEDDQSASFQSQPALSSTLKSGSELVDELHGDEMKLNNKSMPANPLSFSSSSNDASSIQAMYPLQPQMSNSYNFGNSEVEEPLKNSTAPGRLPGALPVESLTLQSQTLALGEDSTDSSDNNTTTSIKTSKNLDEHDSVSTINSENEGHQNKTQPGQNSLLSESSISSVEDGDIEGEPQNVKSETINLTSEISSLSQTLEKVGEDYTYDDDFID